METLTITKKEYKYLIDIKEKIEEILNRKIVMPKKNGFLEAFGILKEEFKGNSLDYISKLRKTWRE